MIQITNHCREVIQITNQNHGSLNTYFNDSNQKSPLWITSYFKIENFRIKLQVQVFQSLVLYETQREKSTLRKQNFLPTFALQKCLYTAIEAWNESAGILKMFLGDLRNFLRAPADSFHASMATYDHFCTVKVCKNFSRRVTNDPHFC